MMPVGISHADPLQNWATITSHTNDWFYGMTYGTVSGNNMFVTVGDSGTLLTSPDGVAWTLGSSGDTHHLFGVGYGNGTFVAVGTVGTILGAAGVNIEDMRVGKSPSGEAALKDVIKKHERLEIRDFGVFQIKQRKARIGRNPATGEQIQIPAKRVVKFRVAKAAKDAILGAK